MKRPSARSRMVERLQTQLDLLRFVRSGHLNWMRDTINPEARRIHRHIAELMEETAASYEDLMKSLENKD